MSAAHFTAEDLADEMGGSAANSMYRAGFKSPYHIADIVDVFGCPVWSRHWPEKARRAFVGALVGTPEVTAEMAKRFHTRAVPAVTAATGVWEAWGRWVAYQDTICDSEECTLHNERRKQAIRATVAVLREGI